MIRSDQLERDAALEACRLMAAAARTAPKTRGVDTIQIFAIDDEKTKAQLIEKMKEIAKAESRLSFERDANAIASSPVILAIGVRSKPSGLNCGYCGYATCAELSKTAGICAYNSIDLGIATASAASVAARLCIDNRLMYSIGRACRDLGLFSKEVQQALGIPLSITGKNPFFDRK